MKAWPLILLVLACNAVAENNATVISTDQLPGCAETIDYKTIYPRWRVKNGCGAPIEILWCWNEVPTNWKNSANVCSKTGFQSSGLIAPEAMFEFVDRPFLDNRFMPSAMLSIQRVCKGERSGHCE